MQRGFFLISLCLILSLFVHTVHADSLQQNGSVTDTSHVLSQGAGSQLRQEADAYAAKTGHHIVIVTVPSVKPATIEVYTTNLAASWSLNDGVMLLTAVQDRQIHVYVSQNLKGDLTTLQITHLLGDEIQPAFHTGNFDEGMKKGVDGIIAALNHQTPEAAVASPIRYGVLLFFITIGVVIFLVIFIGMKPIARGR